MVGRIDLVLRVASSPCCSLSSRPTGSTAAGDARKRAEVFKKCRACQDIGPTAKNKVGFPPHGHPLGHAGSLEGLSCSQANRATGATGLVWTEGGIWTDLEHPTW
jgi:cytochrome c